MSWELDPKWPFGFPSSKYGLTLLVQLSLCVETLHALSPARAIRLT